MPVAPTYPGVYIQEISSGVRTITGVSTSVLAIVGYFSRGPMDQAVRVLSMGDFEREFGGLNRKSEASYAIYQFFQNGGTEAWVVRTASGDAANADIAIYSDTGHTTQALTLQAKSAGLWGNNIRVGIDYPTPDLDDGRFNMTVSLVENSADRELIIQSEVFSGLTVDANDPTNFVQDVVNDESSGSKLISVIDVSDERPLQTGTLSGDLSSFIEGTITNPNPQLTVAIGNQTGNVKLSGSLKTLKEVRSSLESAIRAARPELRAFSQASISVVNNRLRILAGPANASDRVVFSAATDSSDPTVANLGLLLKTELNGVLSGSIDPNDWPFSAQLNIVMVGISSGIQINLEEMNSLDAARAELESKIRAANTTEPAFTNARVVAYHNANTSEERLIILPGVVDVNVSFGIASSDANALARLKLRPDLSANIKAQVSSEDVVIPVISAEGALKVTFAQGTPTVVTLNPGSNANTLTGIANILETAIRSSGNTNSFTNARVAAYESGSSGRLVILSGVDEESVTITASPDNSTTTELGLDTAIANVQSYALGAGDAIAETAQGNGTAGTDGEVPDDSSLLGDSVAKTGMYALRDVDLFNILCIPRTASMEDTKAFTVIATASRFCEERRAFLLVDTPTDSNSVQAIQDWLDDNAGLRSDHAALYFPRLLIPDPLNNSKPRSVGASGTMAGLYARTDSERGVWKAPAGTEATLRNVFKLEVPLTDPENGVLNKVAINCLRTFPIYGSIGWGARTLRGADELAVEYKYIPVRRLALFIEESLFRGLKWVVFEPNDESLWSQIRLNVGAFMQNLFQQGAFQGSTPREAYLVKCDRETTTQNDINQGIVNIVVGFAPLKPAEFVFIKLQQLAGQIQS
ncbi:MAG: phage tail sheath C-terminal domain-containing protein [Cyanobacteria bacterium P01_F01_bin.150]